MYTIDLTLRFLRKIINGLKWKNIFGGTVYTLGDKSSQLELTIVDLYNIQRSIKPLQALYG